MENEKLILELKRYIIMAYKNKLPINEDFVYKLGTIFINNLGLENYIKELKITNLNHKDLGLYNSNQKILAYDLEHVMELLSSVSHLNLSTDSKSLYYYISVLEFLAHEIEHANQYKNVHFDPSNLENMLISYSLMFKNAYHNPLFYHEAVKAFGSTKVENYFKQKFDVYTFNHDLAPEERLANYHAIMLLFEILKEFPQNVDLIKFKEYVFCRYLMMGYDVSLSPTLEYFKKLNIDISSIISNNDDLTLIRRLSLGLKITEKEKEHLILKKENLVKSIYRY